MLPKRAALQLLYALSFFFFLFLSIFFCVNIIFLADLIMRAKSYTHIIRHLELFLVGIEVY